MLEREESAASGQVSKLLSSSSLPVDIATSDLKHCERWETLTTKLQLGCNLGRGCKRRASFRSKQNAMRAKRNSVNTKPAVSGHPCRCGSCLLSLG